MDFSSRHDDVLQQSPMHNGSVGSFHDELRDLRRSMSRSPSKAPRTHYGLLRSPSSPTRNSPLSRQIWSPESGPTRAGELSRDTGPAASNRRNRPFLNRSTPIKGGLFTSIRVESPSHRATRRPLSLASDSGNGSSQSSQEPGEGQENGTPARGDSPSDSQIFTVSRPKPEESPFRLAKARPRSIASTEVETLREWSPARSSPLKRSDGVMNLDQSSLGSPSAKRRSLHGAQASFEIAEDTKSGRLEHSVDSLHTEDTPLRSQASTRTSHAPRKSIAAQRLSDRTTNSKNRRSLELDLGGSTNRRTTSRTRSRNSLDAGFALRHESGEAGDSPLTEHKSQQSKQWRAAPHPLSQALTSASPVKEAKNQSADTFQQATHTPDERPAFSKSLPIGAMRPPVYENSRKLFQPSPSNDFSFATPKPFASAKPDPIAFQSTGLISKRHRNPDDMPPPPGGRGAVPDTPCKKAPAGFDMTVSPTSVNSIAKPRFAQPLFGTPAKTRDSLLSFKASDNAGRRTASPPIDVIENRLTRSASFLSNEGSDSGRSPNGSHGHNESQSSADELPPTPTKQIFGLSSVKSNIKNSSLRSTLFGRRTSVGPNTFAPRDASEVKENDQPFSRRFSPKASGHSFSTPVPQTPAENGFPDPSQLSISPNHVTARTPSWRHSLRSTFSKPPETPSASRDMQAAFARPEIVATPSHHYHTGQDVDPVLSARFEKVVWYSRGEFSQVYKVTQAHERTGAPSYFSATPDNASRSFHASKPSSVFIVKRSKYPHTGSKVRERKLREAKIMQDVGVNEHIVRLYDYWEAKHYLYLQLEFCEEGSLDAFLSRHGNNGRLDDFRIWKIMIEVALGIKHIHDTGHLHLDLKPENIFIDFSGTLKIGDFGLASEWPAPPGVEGEGDRRYIGPDLLMGKFDKPADIFAFGMMMYEIAGNFVPPDNGTNWQKLRSGDFSGLPSLTSGSGTSLNTGISDTMARTDSISIDHRPWSPDTAYSSRPELSKLVTDCDTSDIRMTSTESLSTPQAAPLHSNMTVVSSPSTELATAPDFMLDPAHPQSLDSIVHWMMLPLPADRPVIDQLLNVLGCQWVGGRRRAGAVVWEGKWGPSDAVLIRDTGGVNSRSDRKQADADNVWSQGTFFDDGDAEMTDA